MIALLTGSIASKAPDQIILDVSGVGYQVFIPLTTFYALPDSGSTTLHIHTHVREDILQLFGFLHRGEKSMFILLLSISGVGPKVAVNILSHLSVEQLQTAILGGDVKTLAGVPGIGKKTAERLVLELKDKVGHPPAGTLAGGAEPAAPLPVAEREEEVLSALVNLGYKENMARRALDKVPSLPQASTEEILKQALKLLMK